MNIYCTQKVIDMLPMEVDREENVEGMMHWAANVIQVGHRKYLVLMHTQSLYPMVFAGITQKHFKHFEEDFAATLRAHLMHENIRPEVIESLVKDLDTIHFVKITNRKWIGRLTLWGRMIRELFNDNQTRGPIPEISGLISDDFAKIDKTNYIEPIETWFRLLREYTKIEIFHVRGIRLRMIQEGTKKPAFRVITLPFKITYRQLHHVLKQVIGWRGHYLYAFEISDKKSDDVHLVSMELVDDDILNANEVMLADFDLTSHTIRYITSENPLYNFSIEILGLFDGYNANFPLYEFGEGIIVSRIDDARLFDAYINGELKNLSYLTEFQIMHMKQSGQYSMDRSIINMMLRRTLQKVMPHYIPPSESIMYEDMDNMELDA